MLLWLTDLDNDALGGSFTKVNPACFLCSLDFGDEPRSIDIHAMVSGEGERIPMGKNLKVCVCAWKYPRAQVEKCVQIKQASTCECVWGNTCG